MSDVANIMSEFIVIHQINIIDNKMKKSSMKIPPLAQLYEQKVDFSAHRKKLQQIMSDRKTNLARQVENRTSQSIIKRNLNHYSLKFNAKSLEIAKENSKIMRKIQQIKPIYGFRQSFDLEKQNKSAHSGNSRSRLIEQEKQNYRLKQRVQSMNSSLNNKKMIDDYRRSIQIKKRITHFKTEENKVILKAEQYFSKTSHSKKSNNSRSQQMFNKLVQSPQSLPTIDHSSGKMLIDRKLFNKNEASYYNKQDIIKNKVKINNKLFKYAREKRLKTLLTQQRNALNNLNNEKPVSSKESKQPLFFPTQPK